MAERAYETESAAAASAAAESAAAEEEEVFVFPTSFSQQRLWLVDQLEPESPAYNVPVAWRISGPLDVDALEQSLGDIMRRHEALRTTFAVVDDAPVQVVAPLQRFTLCTEDAAGRIREHMREAARQPFDLAEGPLLRARLWRLAEEEHALLLVMHHIISDGWSVGVLARELAALYEAHATDQPSPLSALPIQYADYAVWQQERWQQGALDKQLAYWKRQLADPVPLHLPTDRPHAPGDASQGATYRLDLPLRQTEALKKMAQREDATFFMVVLAVFKTLLYHYTGQSDVAVGTPVAGRLQREIEPLIGFFVNTLVLRTELSGNPTFREVLGRVRQTALAAYEHQEIPFEKVVEALQPERDPGRNPLFQVLFTLKEEPPERTFGSDLHLEPMRLDTRTAKFDITFMVEKSAEGCAVRIGYRTDVFAAAAIARLAGHFRTLLKAATDDPDRPLSELSLLTDREQRQLLVEWNDTQTDYPNERSVHELFEAQAARTPHAVALIFDDEELTYRELNRRANRLARFLQKKGIQPEDRVGLCMERSPEAIVSMLGILKAGAAYLPLDPDYPEERLRFMLEDAGAQVVLTRDAPPSGLPAHGAEVISLDAAGPAISREPSEDMASGAGAGDVAYVMYTSGSTGKPKGVEVLHRGVASLVLGADYVDFGPDQTFLQFAPLSFDASTFEIWGALLHGGRCVLFSGAASDLDALQHTLQAHHVSTLWLTASLFNVVIDEQPEALDGVRQLLTGGEALSVPHVRKALRRLPGTQLFNGYGPTETTTFATCYPIPETLPEDARSVPIGRPLANTQVYVLDEHQNPVPAGVPGELYIGGDGLARGYLNRPALTAETFIANPFAEGERLYRTGDRVQWRPDGMLAFIGRVDRQVKLRGFRIEPGEIETALNAHAGVKESVICVQEGASQKKRLVAYVVLGMEAPSISTLRAHLKKRLPAYMVPSAFVEIEALPLTPNGKVDREALPKPATAQAGSEGSFVAPRSPQERQLAAICRAVLDVEKLGVHDNLFEAGANSLLVVVISNRAGEAGLPLTPRQFLEHQTVAELSAVARAEQNAGATEQRQAQLNGNPTKRKNRPARSSKQETGSSLVALQPEGRKAPFFAAGLFFFQKLVPHLDVDRPLYGLIRRDLDPDPRKLNRRVQNLAAEYVEEIRAFQPEGPYYVGGFCFGGLIAFEIARQLRAQGRDVALLAMIDTRNPQTRTSAPKSKKLPAKWTKHRRRLAERGPAYLLEWIGNRLKYELDRRERQVKRWIGKAYLRAGWRLPMSLRGALSLKADGAAMQHYVPERYPGRITLFQGRAEEETAERAIDPTNGWSEIAAEGVRVIEVPDGHVKLFEEPHVRVLAERLEACLDEATVPEDA